MGFLDKLKDMFGGSKAPENHDLNAGVPGQATDSTNQVPPTPGMSPDAGQQQPDTNPAGVAPQDPNGPVAPGTTPSQDNDPNRPTQ